MNVHKINKAIINYKKLGSQARASAWFVVCSFFQKGISFITVPIFTRILSKEEYGITALFATWLTIFTIFATLNISGGVYNRGLLQYDEKSYTSSVQALATLCASIVSALIFLLHRRISSFTGLDTKLLFIMCPYLVFIAGINLWTVKERFHFRYKALVSVTIVNSLISTGGGLAAVFIATSNKGNEKVIWTTIGLIIVALPFYVLNFVEGKVFFNKEMWRFSLAFNLPLLPHYLSNIILAQSDRIMINMFCSINDVALYSVAFSIASIVRILTDAITASLVPWRYQALKQKKYEDINKISLIILAFVGIMVGLINLFAPEVLFIFGDRQYRDAVLCIPPVMLSTYFVFAYGMFSNVEFYFLKTGFMMVASISAAALNVVLNYLFINKYGYVACAYTSLVCYIFYCCGHYFYMSYICRKEIPGKSIYDMRWFSIITAATIGLTIVSTLLYGNYYIKYLIVGICIVTGLILKKHLISFVRTIKNLKK